MLPSHHPQATLRWPGAKWQLADWIINQLPPHDGYLEPYFGSGAVFFRKPPSHHETINDLDGDVVQFFQTLRDHPQALRDALALTPWSREEYQRSADPTDDPTERARRFAVRTWQAYGTQSARPTGWKRDLSGGRHQSSPRQWRGLPDRLISAADRLLGAHIECRPAVDLIRQASTPDVLIYADPPYHPSTRLPGLYRHETTHEDHVELLAALLDHPGPVILSGYDCPLYTRTLRSWRQVTHAATSEAGARTESVWLNGPATRRGTLFE